MIENKNESFTNILIFFWDHGHKSSHMGEEIEEIEKVFFFISVVVFNMMKLPSILQVRNDKTLVKESYNAKQSPTG